MSAANQISMKVNLDKSSVCDQCGCTYPYTKEMFVLALFHQQHCICYNCADRLFSSTLHAMIDYDGKLKMKEDMQRMERSSYRAILEEGNNE